MFDLGCRPQMIIIDFLIKYIDQLRLNNFSKYSWFSDLKALILSHVGDNGKREKRNCWSNYEKK